MALQKQSVVINFSQGLDLKSDPFQVPIGNFLSLENTIFSKAGALVKRNGFDRLPSLPDTSYSYLTTYNGNLTAIGTSLSALSAGSGSWINKGAVQPVKLDTLTAVRSNTNQSTCDAAVSPNGLACIVYTDQDPSNLANPIYRYVVIDSTTGQNVKAPTTLTATGTPRVFLLGNNFIIVYANAGTLRFIAVGANTLTAGSPVTITSTYTAATPFDGISVNNKLYLAWAYDTTPAIKLAYVDVTLSVSAAVNTTTGAGSGQISLTADVSQASPILWLTYWKTASTNGYSAAFDLNMQVVLAATQVITAESLSGLTSSASNNILNIFYGILNTYTYDGSLRSDYIRKNTITLAGVAGSASVVLRSVGLASKSFYIDDTIYFLTAFGSTFQPSYFLTDSNGNICMKLAYSNGGGYVSLLPNATLLDGTVYIPYRVKDLLVPISKGEQRASTAANTYSQTGVNLAKVQFTANGLTTAEIGNDLLFSGGMLWMYDGSTAVEHNFNVWPDDLKVTWSAVGGNMAAKPDGATNTNAYAYVAIYQWSDNQGNIYNSAPSIPLFVTTTGALNTGSVTVNIPTLRITYKTANPVKIVLYRWSVAQQVYYQVTSITTPTLNSTSIDYVTIVDTLADSDILGNSILYTTGGIVENIGPPACSAVCLFKSRLFLIDAEDKNLLWFSKQVIESVPVEMSDLFTIYVAPTVSAEGSTGEMRALAALDDKLIIFKSDAAYYITGVGPDNAGANNDFSDPIFITSVVGCVNQNSIAFIPSGLMFQSNKGIWLLGRDLSTQYIGAPVEAFNEFEILSALTVPGTNQVRFNLSNGVVLMYDYYFQQWGSFSGVSALSSTIYQGRHSFINSLGRVYVEGDGYTDGGNPVLISFTTSWLNIAGVQGFERAYFFFLLGVYKSPHKLTLRIAYDYNPSALQISTITPDNYSGPYGSDTIYGGGSPYGGVSNIEQWRVDLQQQKCQSFQITLMESYDPSMGGSPGAGFTLSGLNALIGVKDNKPRLPAGRQLG